MAASAKQLKTTKMKCHASSIYCSEWMNLKLLKSRHKWTLYFFTQSSEAALCALKMVPKAQALGQGSFVSIRHGDTQASLDFIDRLGEAIQKQIEKQEAAESFLLNFAYENANNDCEAILNPVKLTTTSISQFIKACQNTDTKQHGATLLAAAVRGEIKCFNCGRPGNICQECWNRLQDRLKHPPSKDFPPCGKGKHWASERRSPSI